MATVSAACSSVFGGSGELSEALAMEFSTFSAEVAPSASNSDCIAAASSASHRLCSGGNEATGTAQRGVKVVRELMVLHLEGIYGDLVEERARNAALRRQYLLVTVLVGGPDSRLEILHCHSTESGTLPKVVC